MDGNQLIKIAPEQLAQVRTFDDLAQLFHEGLDWPSAEWATIGGIQTLYGIPKEDLEGIDSLRAVRKIDENQTWGIFQVDFGQNKLRRQQLRAVLNRVAEKARQQHDNPTWPSDNILFICRSEGGKQFTLGHFEGEKLANAKLKTFGWDDPLSARTFIQRNIPYLAWKDMARWDKAWDAEALTNDFYKDYKRVFELFEKEILHPRDAETKKLFVQSLFNRLMFLAFIEKMGWLQFDGDKDYLHRLYENHKARPDKDAPTFYHVLELLFFSGLNSINGIGGGSQLSKVLGEVPYLNGGLFNRDPLTEPAGITIPDSAFAEILGDPYGLFRKYTFTVTESTPLDVDVAVDPEMLGKIFEELVTGRHESGSYYTPRPVVSFMCREALKGYLAEGGLAADKAELLVDEHDAKSLNFSEIGDVLLLLSAVKVVDPACGSGAYLLGMLRELYDLVQLVERRRDTASPRELYNVKLDIIQNNIYGVDIDPFAVNIARLRLWLSLAVDHKGGKPEPLPNLDYKIEAGDSLAAPNPTAASGDIDIFRDDRIREFDRLKKLFGKPAVTREEHERKADTQKEIDALRLEIRQWYRANTPAKSGVFDWRVEFAEVFQERHDTATIGGQLNLGIEAGRRGQGELAATPKPGGFDIVLANPPYVRQEGIVQNFGADYKAALVKNYPDTGSGTADLFIYFYDRGLQLLRPGGMFVYISSNKWFKASYGSKLRKHIATTTQIQSITDFGDLPVFKTAMAYAMIFIARRTGSEPVQTPLFASVTSLQDPYPDVKAVLSESGAHLPPDAIQGEDWTLADQATLNRLRIMKSRGVPLGEYVKGQIFRGILTGLNEAFVIDGATRQRLIEEDPKSDEIIKPLAVGKDIRRWRIEDRDRWLIFTRRGIRIDDFPAVKLYLNQFKERLTPKPKDWKPKAKDESWPGRKGGSYKWYEIQDEIAYFNKFEFDRIVYPDMSQTPRYALARAGILLTNTAYMICSDEKSLLAILNSRTFNSQLESMLNKNQGETQRAFSDVFAKAIVPSLPKIEKDILTELIEKLLEILEADEAGDISVIEKEIDERLDFYYFKQIGDENFDQWNIRTKAEKATEVGILRLLISKGEDDAVEFKSSVIWNVRADRHDLVMRDEVLKEICAFLNADGGTILCGVDDDGNVLGLEKDLRHAGNKDKLALVLTNAMGELLKPNPVELVKLKFIEIDGQTILRITVQGDPQNRYESPSTKKEDAGKNIPRTHVRVGASAKALEAGDLINWWNRRQSR